ncbi:hypothetical protein C3B78_08100 [Arthrobacter sp. PGP41]|uniref:DUF4365 domain-containing protein n=1 Tax=Arthrobacter sp. PGP41 TaxID=2079227 RepID=UPI000CDC4F37|nr:DUF4365 domain-containing protein [Arthrobacter sp. PGP41]AUZ34416.1 hypothetical protein C3B78_08100 [Arthrobacter sp. PGP41]
MRAGETEDVGTAGQSIVKSQFEKLRWGANPNPDHDLGTDLWLQPRDERRVDLNSIAGAQVKSSRTKGPKSKYFKNPSNDDQGNLEGWWYYEAENDHFDYWTKHTAPHFLILHDLETGESYWVHVTQDRLQSTGGGTKILVPVHQLVDEAHNRKLIEVATSERPHIPWEGSAWGGANTLAAGDVLRHALIVPRLVAPHRNDQPKTFKPEQAVAALVLLRQSDLEGRVPDAEGRNKSKLWCWAFVTALESYLQTEDPEVFRDALDSAKKASDKVAVVCTWVAAHLEHGEASDALALLDKAIDDDCASAEDHVWLLVQRARCLNELGRRDEAKMVALEALQGRNSAPDDSTLSALCGAASWIVFSSTPFGARSFSDVITGSDNLASWWRTQVMAWGLSSNFEEQFRTWSQDSTRRVGFEDSAWRHLRASSLIAGLVGDQGSWTQSYARLAKLQLMRTTEESDVSEVAQSLTMLRESGDHKGLSDAVHRIVHEGPAESARSASEAVKLEESTRTTLRSNMALLKAAADVVTPQTADSAAQWCMEHLLDLPAFHEKYLPGFYAPIELLRLLAPLVPALSDSGLKELLKWLEALPEQPDHFDAQTYGVVFRAVADRLRGTADIEKLVTRPAGDHAALTQVIAKLRAQDDPNYRLSLLKDIEKGDQAALHSFGDVESLTEPAVRGMLDALAKEVNNITAMAGALAYGGGTDSVRTLVLLNLWHPEYAQWEPFLKFLEEPRTSKDDLVGCLSVLGRLPLKITADRERLTTSLRRLMSEKGGEGEWLFGAWADVRGLAAEALFAVDPDSVTEEDIWVLMRGSSGQKHSAARIIAQREKAEEFGLLVALSASDDTSVRAIVANRLAGWVSRGIAGARASALLSTMLDSRGTELPQAVIAHVQGAPQDEGVTQIIDRYKDHISATVRRAISTIQERAEPEMS